MSTRGSRGPLVRGGPVRNSRRRKIALDVDLNAPPIESHDQGMSSHQATAQDMQTGIELSAPSIPTIDVEALDDDVVISSPRTFAEAKYNSRFNRRTVVVDLDSDCCSIDIENSSNGAMLTLRGNGVRNCRLSHFHSGCLASLFTSCMLKVIVSKCGDRWDRCSRVPASRSRYHSSYLSRRFPSFAHL